MEWLNQFHLFLFDFDGVLVNTEKFHYTAYKKMCLARGYDLDWDFTTYCSYAMYDAHALKEAIYKKFPKLHKEEPDWAVLYKEKKHFYSELIASEKNFLMPGVDKLLFALAEKKIKRCVVTHSSKEHVKPICEKHEALKTIPFWITREDYEHPKPHPECYEKAISKYAEKGDKVIGFEDSPRGFQALHNTSAFSVFVSSVLPKQAIVSFTHRPYSHISSFEEFCEKGCVIL